MASEARKKYLAQYSRNYLNATLNIIMLFILFQHKQYIFIYCTKHTRIYCFQFYVELFSFAWINFDSTDDGGEAKILRMNWISATPFNSHNEMGTFWSSLSLAQSFISMTF